MVKSACLVLVAQLASAASPCRRVHTLAPHSRCSRGHSTLRFVAMGIWATAVGTTLHAKPSAPLATFGNMRSRAARIHLGVTCTLIFGCHVRSDVLDTRLTNTQREVDRAASHAGTARIVVAPGGSLRFEVPQFCDAAENRELTTHEHTTVRPNMATFVVGLIATSVGITVSAQAFANGEVLSNPTSFAGPTATIVGATLVIGPWLGNRSEERFVKREYVRRPIAAQECGTRPIGPANVQLDVAGRKLVGALDENGMLDLSPFDFMDAHDPEKLESWNITAQLTTAEGSHHLEGVVEAARFATQREAFLKQRALNQVGPFEKVATLHDSSVAAYWQQSATGARVRIHAAVVNGGPGTAWALRAALSANVPELDGRVIYFGNVPKNGSAERDVFVPIAPQVAAALKGTPLVLGLTFNDEYGSVAPTPAQYSGMMLVDAFAPTTAPRPALRR